jgi:hypothetical protein
MKKLLTTLTVLTSFLFLPFAPMAEAATATGSITVDTTTPNAGATVITFPALSGGVDAGVAASATSTIEVTGTTGSTTSIMVGSTELLTGDVAFNTDASTTAADLAAAINANTGTSGYSATAVGSTIIITAPSSLGVSINGTAITVSSDYLTGATSFSGGADAGAAVSASSLSSSFASTMSATTSSDLSLNIGGTAVSLSAGLSAHAAASTTADAINADLANPYTATVENTDQVRLTADTAGAAGNGAVVATDLSYNTTAQVTNFSPTDITVGETYRISINGTSYDFTANASSTVADVTAALAVEADANAAVTCTEDGMSVTCTADTAGTAFVANSFVFPASFSGSVLLNPVSITSDNTNTTCAKIGDTVTLNFTSSESLGASTTAMIDGEVVPVVSLGGNMYSASTTVSASTTEGVLSFMISPYDSLNAEASSTASTTNGTSVTVHTSAPNISVIGDANMNLALGATFTDPGATSTDASAVITADGSVNVSTPDTYIITYTATDCAGNVATTTRSVTVNPATPTPGGHRHGSSSVSFGQFVSAIAHILPPITTGPALPIAIRGEVLGASTSAEAQAKIASIKAQLSVLISELIAKLQAEIAAKR